MRPIRMGSLLAAMTYALLVAAGASAALVPSEDGATVHDTVVHQCRRIDVAHDRGELDQRFERGPYLGHANWQLPLISAGESCGFGCTDNPMGNLYYNQLHLSQERSPSRHQMSRSGRSTIFNPISTGHARRPRGATCSARRLLRRRTSDGAFRSATGFREPT